MPFSLCNKMVTVRRLMAQALTRVTKKYGNLVMCYVDDVVIATLHEWSEEAQAAFENIKRELGKAPVLGMTTENGMYVLDTDASVVYCSRYMTDWDRNLSQVMGAYNSTQQSTTGVSPYMMLTGHEKSLPLTFFYPEYEGKKTSPQVYVRDVVRRQQELNDLCGRNTQQTQARQRKTFDKKSSWCKNLLGSRIRMRISERYITKRNEKAPKKVERITEVNQEGRFID